MPLPVGKLPESLMRKLLSHFEFETSEKSDTSIYLGPRYGQDTGILRLGEQYLVIKANPVTFATSEIGFYSVILNANDIATSGAIPKWFSCTILLPEKVTDEDLCEQIFQDIAKECAKLEIEVIAGHTEVTYGLDRPIISGMMIGIHSRNLLPITTFGGKVGDRILLVKHIAIEGTAIIAREKEEYLLSHGFSREFLAATQIYLHMPGIGIVREAQLLSNNFPIHAMHGPTEGGFNKGLIELASNSKCGVVVQKSAISLLEPTQVLCEHFHLDPFQLIASGCLIVAVDPMQSHPIVSFLQEHDIYCKDIGLLTQNAGEYRFQLDSEEFEPIKASHIDEITKIF